MICAGVAAVHVPSQHCQVVVHGYIANRNDLRLRFCLPSTVSDAELIACAYRHFGNALSAHVFGEYAAVLLDEEQAVLLLTHDALGIVGLFYVERPDEFLFGSNLDDLIAVTGIGELDEQYIAETLAGVEDHGDRTPYRQVRRIRQGCSLVVRGAAVRSVRNYDPSAATPLSLRDAAEHEEMFRRLAVEAVSTAIPSKGKVWCELSGGLDSSTLVSLAAGMLRADIETFSVVFSRSDQADETGWIETVLQSYPLSSHRLDADSFPPFSLLPDRFQAEPTGASLIWEFDEARRALFREHGVDVVLTGMCGDAVFVGDGEPYYLADIVNPVHALRELRGWQRGEGSGRPLSYWFRQYVLRPRIRRLTGKRTEMRPPAWINPSYMERWFDAGRERQPLQGLSIADEHFWDRVLRGALLVGDGQQILPERCGFRNPWLYLPLVEFMAAVPWREKLRPGLDRALQRAALRGILPEPTRSRRTKQVPSQALFGGLKTSELWAGILTDCPAIVERGYVDGARWRKAVELARYGHCPSFSAFMQACILEAWFLTLQYAPRTVDKFRGLSPLA